MAELKSSVKPAPKIEPKTEVKPEPKIEKSVDPVAPMTEPEAPKVKEVITVKTVYPYRLDVPTQKRALEPQVPTEVKNDRWIQAQIKAKVLEEVI
jgi:hypothetical protein